ncbi:MAG TPA: RluA family pseudouridine synthase [Parapedobacter sp.]|uniref:RluA family pseudouridine synthase n=1 Tax=Parapedobacter sp. TaxID=1958893 RepID=UPI002CEC54A4|nr:RluA family pseudouridine synthase [Parapedobacter sp.]HWK56211.1 RluA family pseudouridine synthase [Parapedobacter sp.]
MNNHDRYAPKLPQFAEQIIYEDDNLIVINKPPFLASLDEREGGEPSVLRLAKKYHPDAQVCHRLDKETSGVLLIAKNPETYRLVSIEFERRRVTKVYHAIIGGTHVFEDLLVDLPILNLGNKNVTIDRANGKRAETYFNSLRYFKHFTLVECRPVTGRMHQIRIHLATQQAAIVGDTLYHGKPVYLSQIKKRGFSLGRGKEEQPIMRRFALHAHELRLTIGDSPYHFQAPYPKDFATLLRQLEKYDD